MSAAAVVAVTLLRLPLGPFLGNSVPFILYFPAVVVAGWFGGFGPGLAATLLSGYCAKTWFFDPVGTFTIPDLASAFRLGLFLVSGALTSFLCGQLHRRQEELRREKELLEQNVKTRTLHLERALQDMEAFSYTVSHDLRSPMRAIHGFSELLLEEYGPVLGESGRERLERIRSAATRLDDLINDLLAFAKVSGTTVETHPIALAALLPKIIERSPHLAGGKASVDCAGCVHVVLAHETLLDQVLQNLLENAVKFVAAGVKPQIRLWSEPHEERIRLWISDNGIGIDASDQKRLFKMFERAAPGNYPGTGIGLAIVERAVVKMNGRVGVESQPGHGSLFWIDLPPSPAGRPYSATEQSPLSQAAV